MSKTFISLSKRTLEALRSAFDSIAETIMKGFGNTNVQNFELPGNKLGEIG